MVAARTSTPSDQMLMALGAGTLHWSMLEASIDAMVAMTFHRFGANAVESELPRMMGRKLKFLKKGFRRSTLLKHLAEDASALFDRVDALSEKRNLLIHGAPNSYWKDRIEFTWLRVTPTIHMVEYHSVSHAEMHALAFDILHIAGEVANLAKRLADWVTREHEQKPNSELP